MVIKAMKAMNWQEIFGNWVLVPDRPIGIIHFLGGAFVAAAPHLTYRRLLEHFADRGYVIVATPFINTFEHTEIAETVLWSFNRAVDLLHDRYDLADSLPVYGLGHSMGCKLHLLIGSLFENVDRAGNVLVSFNNYGAEEAIPFLKQLPSLPFLDQFTAMAPSPEFTPSPAQTNKIIASNYIVRRNLLIKFANDTIDQSLLLANILEDVHPGMITTQRLKGNHLTPLGQDIKGQSGFNPIDNMGQMFRQEFFKELAQVESTIGRWLNPAGLAGERTW
jgi:Protein of unknown function (DUF1350)